jgi:hypothetical protein
MLLVLAVSITFKIIYDLKSGDSLTKSLLETLVWSVVTYSLMYGMFWYLTTQVFTPDGKWIPMPTFPTSPVKP